MQILSNLSFINSFYDEFDRIQAHEGFSSTKKLRLIVNVKKTEAASFECEIIKLNSFYKINFFGMEYRSVNVLGLCRWMYDIVRKNMHISHIIELIILPSLYILDCYDKSYIRLMAGTMLCQSGCEVVSSRNSRRLLGLYMMSPRQIRQVKRYLTDPKNKELHDIICVNNCTNRLPENDAIIYNSRYATMLAVLYYRISSLPKHFICDALSLSMIYRQYFKPDIKINDYEQAKHNFRRVEKLTQGD